MHLKKITKMQLMAILSPYDNWFGDKMSTLNLEAKKALLEFLELYKVSKLDKEYIVSQFGHLGYLTWLIPIRKALKENNYQQACNEVETLIHNEPIFQKRIHNNLISLLEKYLNI